MFDSLSQRLTQFAASLRGRGRLSESDVAGALREVRVALLEADVALPVVKDLVESVRLRALGAEVARSLTPGQTLVLIVRDELSRILSAGDPGFELRVVPPAVVLLAGLQGVGKTTTAAKLARHLVAQRGKRVLLASTDLRRPAAIEQLARLAEQAGVEFLRAAAADPVEVARQALVHARQRACDVLVLDTAGRLHVDAELMAEVRAIHDAVAPVETLFVVDAMAGQDAAESASAFGAALPLTGIVLTKADGDARGGAALSVASLTRRPIKFIGTSEKLDGLEAFDAARLAGRILGMGDLLGLVEKVQAQASGDRARALAQQVAKGEGFDLTVYRDQLRQMLAMGGIGALLEQLPGAAGVRSPVDDRILARQAAIIDSMSALERRRPAVIDGSRRRRIAAGAGVQVQDVNRLLKQYDELQRTMKRLKGGGLQKLMRSLGGRSPGGSRR